jgi:hypothetical protein
MSAVAELREERILSPWRRMESAPKRGWITCKVVIEGDIVATAARWVPEHGAFCAAPAGGIEHPLWPYAWMPQPADTPPID